MLGHAALAMWWDIAPGMRDEFEHWHSHEHFPERLALPGFLRATRWADAGGGEGFLVMYELAAYEALISPEYLERLNAPSEWSRKMMPHHRHMVRSQCRVLEGRGSVVAAHAVTVRLSPSQGKDNQLRGYLHALVLDLPGRAGLAGAHLLKTDTPAIAPTTEQKIRSLADDAADWIFIASGYHAPALRALLDAELSDDALQRAGAAPGVTCGAYGLRLSMVAPEAG